MGQNKRTISICIPVYNESKNLPVAIETVERLFQAELKDYQLEIVVTDNASTDETWKVVEQLAASRSHLKAYRFSRNFGYQSSVFAGLSLATGDAVVELDADLEDPPHVISEFVKKWEQGYEVAYGVRAKRHAPLLLRFLFFVFYRTLNRISDIPIPENAGDFRLLDRKVVDLLRQLPERNLYLRGLVSYLGFKQTAVVYDRNARLFGKSKFMLLHYFILAVDALTAFSKAPLRMIGALGGLMFVLSFGLAGYYLLKHLYEGTPIPGFTTLVVLLLILQSINFIFLGILGEYLSRIFDDSKFRPRVIISQATNARDFPRTL